MPYYAVETDEVKEIYETWGEASEVALGVKGARYKKFRDRKAARAWLGLPDDSDSDDDGVTHVFTDGACTRNGTPRARGGIGVFFADGDQRNVSEPLPPDMHPTNNRAELMAITRAADLVSAPAVIHTDSQYAHKALTAWIYGWTKSGWITRKGTPVENREIIEPLFIKLTNKGIQLEHVPAHCGIHGNEEADRLAREACAQRRVHFGDEQCAPKQ